MRELHDHDLPLIGLQYTFVAELKGKDKAATLRYWGREDTLAAIPRVVQYYKFPPHIYLIAETIEGFKPHILHHLSPLAKPYLDC